jgi:hypothetical protein
MAEVRVGNAQRSEVLLLLTRALDARAIRVDEYDRRVAAVGTAIYAADLAAQLRDLPREYEWRPGHVRPPARAYGRTALILGVLSVPLSMCLVGWIFGILALLYSRRGPATGPGAAMLGRVFGILGIVLSVGAGVSVWFALDHRLGA